MNFWLQIYALIWFAFLAAAVTLRWKQIWGPRNDLDPLSYDQPYVGSRMLLCVFGLTMAWPLTVPILLWIVVGELFQKPYERPTEKVFAPALDALQTQVTLADIERAEVVFDPLNAAPEIPFGHLNATWLAFRKKLRPDTTLWTYGSRWANNWNRLEEHQGYAAVSNGEIIAFFETDILNVEE